MVKIISKIGISEFKNCFKSTSVSEKIKSNMDFSAIGLEVINRNGWNSFRKSS